MYIFGHKNPDTDSICSAIVYGEYLKDCGFVCEAIKLGDLNNETKFILDKFNADYPQTKEKIPAGSEVVLIDHNEKAQTIDNIDELELVEIIDHHKFSLATAKPLKITAEPLGSSCSIVAKIMFQKKKAITAKQASLLISGIISDTLYFRSPTTTPQDKEIMLKLNKIAQIEDLEKYSLEMFAAKSDLGDMPVENLVRLDYKVFDFSGKKFGIGVMETTSPEYGIKRMPEIVEKLNEIKQKDNLYATFLSIVDILNEQNTTIFPTDIEAEILKRVFNAQIEGNIAHLGKVISRKKQIAPVLEKSFQ